MNVSPVATRRALIAGVAAVAIAAVALFAGNRAGHPVDASPISSASASSSTIPAATTTTAIALPAAASPSAGLGAATPATPVTEAPAAAVEDPTDDVIIEAVDPAEALFGDLEPIATTN
jgi:hypothetical protein